MNIELKANNVPTKPGDYIRQRKMALSSPETVKIIDDLPGGSGGLYLIGMGLASNLRLDNFLWSDAITFTTNQPR